MGRAGGVLRRQGGARRLAAQGAYLACLRIVSERRLAEVMAKTYRARQARRSGALRSSDRALAIHLAREAFGAPLYALSRAAGCAPSVARNNSLNIWERRDRHPELDQVLWAIVRELKEGA